MIKYSSEKKNPKKQFRNKNSYSIIFVCFSVKNKFDPSDLGGYHTPSPQPLRILAPSLLNEQWAHPGLYPDIKRLSLLLSDF